MPSSRTFTSSVRRSSATVRTSPTASALAGSVFRCPFTRMKPSDTSFAAAVRDFRNVRTTATCRAAVCPHASGQGLFFLVFKLRLEGEQLGERRIRIGQLLTALRRVFATIVETLVGTGTATIVGSSRSPGRSVLGTRPLSLCVATLRAMIRTPIASRRPIAGGTLACRTFAGGRFAGTQPQA